MDLGWWFAVPLSARGDGGIDASLLTGRCVHPGALAALWGDLLRIGEKLLAISLRTNFKILFIF
jgi:hypothetical protein